MKGRDVLEALVKLERTQSVGGVKSVSAGALGRHLGRMDGRSVTPTLKKLERAGLVERVQSTRWRATDRGREVDAIMERITFTRGGAFAPITQHISDLLERHALR